MTTGLQIPPIFQKKPRWKSRALIGVTLIILGSMVGFFLVNKNADKKADVINYYGIHSIAILSFQNLNLEQQTELNIENGFYQSLRDKLNNSIVLLQAPRSLNNNYPTQQSDISYLKDKLDVDLLIEGSIKQTNNQFVLTINLIRVSDGQRIMTRTFSDNIEDISKMEGFMAYHIAIALIPSLQEDLIQGVGGQAFSFDGIDDYVSVPNQNNLSFGTGDFTVSFWAKFNDLANNENGLIHKDNYGSSETYQGWLFNICDDCAGGGGIGFETRNISQGIDNHARFPTSNFQTGKWYHFVGVRNFNTLYLYVNGVLRAKVPETSPTDVSNGIELNMGSLGIGSQQFFDGLLDEVVIYDRAISAKEISTPISRWQADGNTRDSENINPGILQNGATFIQIEEQQNIERLPVESPSIPAEINSPNHLSNEKTNTLNSNSATKSGSITHKIGWDATASRFYGEIGQILNFECPPGGIAYNIYGNNIYTEDSSICTAAVHAGIINFMQGGKVTIEYRGGAAIYESSIRQGIKSIPWGEHRGSFVFH